MALRLDEWRLKMTENVQRTLSQLTGASDKAAAKFVGVQNRIQGSIGRMASGIKTGVSGAWNAAGAQFNSFKSNMLSSLPIPPQMATAIGALAGPLGIAIGLAAVLTLGFMKGVKAAEAFGVPFRELRNLNLDKSKEEIQALNDDLLKLSFDKGLDAQAITKGYYDIQSATGLYGQEVLDMTGRIGEASRALNMDYSAAVNGVSKAMLAFKMNAGDLDRIMASNAKTVQVGVVTFDELAKSQTEYAGAAAAINQELDTSNKVFAALTQSTKNAQVAATMTKGAFQDLAKGPTVAGLKKIGVSVFDAAGGMRQADDILRDLIPQLAQMSDQTFSALKEEIGGSEGLRGLLDQAKGSGDNLLRTMDAFDASKFDLNKAIEQGNSDLDIMKDKLGNQINAKFVELGQLAMPLVVGMMQGFSWVLDKVVMVGTGIADAYRYIKQVYDGSILLRTVWEGFFFLIKSGWEIVAGAFKATLAFITAPIKAIVQALSGDFSAAYDTLAAGGDDIISGFGDAASGIGDAFNGMVNGISGKKVAVEPVMNTDGIKDQLGGSVRFNATPVGAGDPLLTPSSQPGGPVKKDPFAHLFPSEDKKTGSTVKQGVSEVVGGGKQVRNVTVNIQSLVKELVIQTNSVREGSADIQRAVTDALVRAVNGSELVLAND